ncbi:MAG: putative ubiE/COQ5 methyltransferase [Phenylobacterium sp.]|nr:putative ubiE/COQ5 methyltransferase [Phenylobacterium sp.]
MGSEHAAAAPSVLARFPKARPALTPQIQAIYLSQYQDNRSGRTPAASAAQQLERWMHRRVAADITGGAARATLELGAGTLNQLPFERFTTPYDIVEPFRELYADSPERGRLRDVFADIAEVPPERRYPRITSIAAVEHMCDLPLVLARVARLLADGGSFRVAYPSEGGLLWRLGWMATTGLEFRLRHGLDYGVLMRHEHVNTAHEIEVLLKALFGEVRISSFGLGRQLSLYRFAEARGPRLETAAAWEQAFHAPSRVTLSGRRKPVGSSSR